MVFMTHLEQFPFSPVSGIFHIPLSQHPSILTYNVQRKASVRLEKKVSNLKVHGLLLPGKHYGIRCQKP